MFEQNGLQNYHYTIICISCDLYIVFEMYKLYSKSSNQIIVIEINIIIETNIMILRLFSIFSNCSPLFNKALMSSDTLENVINND